jgi:hypothetical protein
MSASWHAWQIVRAAAGRARRRVYTNPQAPWGRSPSAPPTDLSDLDAGQIRPRSPNDLARAVLGSCIRGGATTESLRRPPADRSAARPSRRRSLNSNRSTTSLAKSHDSLNLSQQQCDRPGPRQVLAMFRVHHHAQLLCFSLELNKIGDAVLRTNGVPALVHYRPWIEDIHNEKPHQRADRMSQRSGRAVCA